MEVLRWRRSDEGKLALATVAAELLGAAGARQLRCGRRRRGMARAGAGGVKAAFRRVVACVIKALATRGRRHGHAARGSCRCWPLKVAIQFIQS